MRKGKELPTDTYQVISTGQGYQLDKIGDRKELMLMTRRGRMLCVKRYRGRQTSLNLL